MDRFFLAHYLETRVQLTMDHVLYLGTLNTEKMVQQTRIGEIPNLDFFLLLLLVLLVFLYKRSFQELAEKTGPYLPLKL